MSPAIKGRFWTGAEDDVLRMDYGRHHAHHIARNLNRTIPAIEQRAFKLGLSSKLKRGRTPQGRPNDALYDVFHSWVRRA